MAKITVSRTKIIPSKVNKDSKMAIMVKMDRMVKMDKMDRMVKMDKIMKPRIQLMKVKKPSKSLHPPRLPYTALLKNKLDISNSLDLNFQRSQVFESFWPILKICSYWK